MQHSFHKKKLLFTARSMKCLSDEIALCVYRIYVHEGQTEVQVQDWTLVNRASNEYYFIFDTRDKIPNEYFIDIKVESSGEVNTYKRQIKFQVVNVKYSE